MAENFFEMYLEEIGDIAPMTLEEESVLLEKQPGEIGMPGAAWLRAA